MNELTQYSRLVSRIVAIADSTSKDLVESVLVKLLAWDSSNWSISSANALEHIHQPQVRADFFSLFDLWKKDYPDLPGSALALSLKTCLETIAQEQQTHVDLVWTGPDSRNIPFRRTDQALLELINSAKEKLLIVSFAVYKIKAISEALAGAVERGVKLVLVLEDPEESEGKIWFSAYYAFNDIVLCAAKIYSWPLANRPTTEEGHYGSLHAKLAVADRERLFISSANLTEYAMNLNMEMGVLIEGGELPGKVVDHFKQLVFEGHLRKGRG